MSLAALRLIAAQVYDADKQIQVLEHLIIGPPAHV
jgi:hypothetical protein